MSSNPSSIEGSFLSRRAEGRRVLIPYLTAGYPDAATSMDLMEALASSGGDVLELGIPFSDPLADGPTIQRSSFQALKAGMTAEGALQLLRAFRRTHDHPVVIFTYLNPLLRFGFGDFLCAAQDSGAQGLLVTDLPTGSDPRLEDQVVASDLDLIRLLAPTTREERIKEVSAGGSGFLYYISRTGVTGARQELRAEIGAELEVIRRVVSLPVAVGFGISTPEQAAAAAGVADGVVVGSALIDALDHGGVEEARTLMEGLRRGMDSGTAPGG